MHDWFTSSANLISLGSILIALASAVYARSSVKVAKRSYELAAVQDARRDPKLSLYLADSYALISKENVAIAISVTVSNPSDIDNSVKRAELCVAYHRQDEKSIVMKIPSTSTAPHSLADVSGVLDPPVSLLSHQSVAGLLIFEPPAMILRGSVIDEYSLHITDSHEMTVSLANITVRESFGT
jgi:hypothetical protein